MNIVQQPHFESAPSEVMPLRENKELQFGSNKSAQTPSDTTKSELKFEIDKNKPKGKKKKVEEPPAPQALREVCEKENLFDQISSDETDLKRINEIDAKLARLDQLKRELYESMTVKTTYKKEVTQ
jgi:hypothetical protein